MTDLPSLLGALQAEGVRFIVVGGIAGIAHGAELHAGHDVGAD